MARMIDGDVLYQEFEAMLWHDNADRDLAEDMLLRMPTLTPPNEWISVDEKLPENGQIVLFHQKDGFIYCAEYFAGNALMSPGWFIDNDCWDAKDVTHWMPLPKSPKEDE